MMKTISCAGAALLLAVSASFADDDTLRDLGALAAPGEVAKFDGTQWRAAHDDITEVNAGDGLTGGGSNLTVTLSVDFGGTGSDTKVARYAEMDATRPPVGAIVAWAKSHPGVSTNLTAGWVECNGQTLADPDSTLDGTVIPNLNGYGGGTNRFLRGATASGSTGGSDVNNHTHQVSGTTSEMNFSGSGGWGANGMLNHRHSFNVTSQAPSDTNNMPAFYAVVWIMRIK